MMTGYWGTGCLEFCDASIRNPRWGFNCRQFLKTVELGWWVDSGAKDLNFWKKKQERESAIAFVTGNVRCNLNW